MVRKLVFEQWLKSSVGRWFTLVACAFGIALFYLIPVSRPGQDYLTKAERQWLKANEGTIEVLFGYEAPPNAFHDDTGEYVGLLVDVFNRFEQRMDVSIPLREFDTWKKLMEYSEQGRSFIIVGIAETPQRERFLSFTAPFIKIPYVIVTRKGDTISRVEDLETVTVCTVANYAVNEYLADHFPSISPVGVMDNLEGLRGVSTGQFDAMVINQMYATHLIHSQGLSNLRIVNEVGYYNRLSAATAKGDIQLFTILDKTVDQFSLQEREVMYEKWIGGGNLISREVLAWAGGISAAGLVALFTVWGWGWSLRRALASQTGRLQQSEEEYRAFFEDNHSVMIVVEPETGLILDANRAAQGSYGYSREEMLSMSVFELNALSRAEIVRRIRAAAAMDLHSFVTQHVKANGEVRDVEVFTGPFEVHGKKRLISVIHDITERLRNERDLAEAKEAAETASRAKSEFLANMSHEIRTPLNGVHGMLQLMHTTSMSGEQVEYVDSAIESSKRLTHLLSDILDLSRVEAGGMPLSCTRLSLHLACRSLEELFHPALLQSGLAFTCDIDPAIPLLLVGDDTRLQQVLGNLVGNALKFTESGGVALSISSLPSPEPDSHRVLFTVSDSGVGIPDDKIDTLFEPFTQVIEGYRRSHQGAGLGLAISRRLVSLMGGDLAVESRVGEGTTFCFSATFGLLPPEEVQAVYNEATELGPALRSLDGMKILLAEDERCNSLVCSRLLSKGGAEVDVVQNGEQALEALRNDVYDLVLMDIQMPVMDGVEATQAIRDGVAGEAIRTVPIIALTAYSMVGDQEKFLSAGMDGYLSKPVDLESLREVIRTVLDSSST